MNTFPETVGRGRGSQLRSPVWLLMLWVSGWVPVGWAAENVYLTEVPDYEWHHGCFGTASGNLIGYWDRRGLANLYTGPTADGVAPLTSFGSNRGILSLWASQAGLDGRPIGQPGHHDNYWQYYESVGPDPYRVAGRTEHAPDCIGDFIGLNQDKWADLGGECAGNIDGYSFNFFDRTGQRRVNYLPHDGQGQGVPDIQSGLRAFAAWRGVAVDTFSQLTDFNPDHPGGGVGFSFADLRAEIDAGYPVLIFLQRFGNFSRTLQGVANVNPSIHAVLAYGYVVDDNQREFVRIRTSWASGDRQFGPWTSDSWLPEAALNLPARGVIGFRPRPQLVEVRAENAQVHLRWQGPLSVLRDEVWEVEVPVSRYVVERSTVLDATDWEAVTEPLASLTASVPGCCEGSAFYRIRLVEGRE